MEGKRRGVEGGRKEECMGRKRRVQGEEKSGGRGVEKRCRGEEEKGSKGEEEKGCRRGGGEEVCVERDVRGGSDLRFSLPRLLTHLPKVGLECI